MPRFPSHPPPPEHPIGARLSRSQVLAIAEKTHGKIRLEEVEMVFITEEDGNVWKIFFPSPQPEYIGGGSIEIDDATGKATPRYAK